MSKKVVVIRIGAKMIHIAHMENAQVNPTIYGCVRIPTPAEAVKEGQIVDITEVARRIKKACIEKGIKTADVVFTVESSKIANRETTIPVVAKAKVSQVVLAKVADLFPVDTDKYIFSHVLQGRERSDEEDGKVQDVLVYAAPADLIDSYYALADALGMNVIALEADGNAVFQIMKRQVNDDISMAIQINQDSTLVNIISKEKLLLQRMIPYGINVFTEAMMMEDVFQTSDFDAAYEVLSTQRVLVPNLNQTDQGTDVSLSKRIEVTNNGTYLIGNISRVIEYYNSKYKGQPIQEIICTGMGCDVAGIHELLSNELGIKAFTPNNIIGVKFNRRIEIDFAILQYINCFGAVFSPVSFVAKDVAMRKAKKGTMTGAVTIFVLCAVVSVVLIGFSCFQVFTAQSERDVIYNRLQQLQSVQDEYNQLSSIENDYSTSQNIADFVDSHNNHLHNIIKKIAKNCPKNFKINSITTDEMKATVNATSSDKLLSVSALQVKLNEIEDISDLKIDVISETVDPVTKMRQYSCVFTFYFTDNDSKEEGE